MTKEIGIFAAGCFWGVEESFLSTQGVTETEVGYIGGTTSNPSYEDVCRGDTNHAEAVRVFFDSEIIMYQELLDVFFKIHNPTTLNRQGYDFGTQYRSAIFYQNDSQKKISEDKSKNYEKEVQKITDLNIEKIDKILSEKEKEILNQ